MHFLPSEEKKKSKRKEKKGRRQSTASSVCPREKGQKGIAQVGVPVQQFLKVRDATGRGIVRIATKDFGHGQPVCPRPMGATGDSQVPEQEFRQFTSCTWKILIHSSALV